MKSCSDCKWAILEDHGYSNYTVEGTNFICAQRAHPDGVFDNWYGKDKRLQHAEKCEHYVAGSGSPLNLDVEGEAMSEIDSWPAEHRAAWELHVTFEMLEGKRG